MAAECHELMLLQHTMRPSAACVNDNWTHGAEYKHTTASVNCDRLQPTNPY